MKRWLAALLALAMTLMVNAGMAEAETSAMPQIGESVHGFELVETRDFALIGAKIYRFVHSRTGGELYYLANDDINRVFELVFHTQAIDNTGLPHVFEHATLAGSKKYPSRDLWFNLHNGSYNTFMNAYTAQNHTGYPVASLSEAQLLKYADFYTDCCLNPMILEDESIFREEAWRYRMNSPEDPLTLEGTVYSEMQGRLSIDQWALYNSRRLMLPGSYAANVSGGDPDAIPDMTYEALKAYHQRYYHPSNCVAYLYGRLEHYEEFLALLDEAYAPYERREIALEDPDYTPITAPVEGDFAFPSAADARTENAAYVVYSVLCPGLRENPEAARRMSMLVSLLNDDTFALARAMEQALPEAQWGCTLNQDGPEDYLYFICANCNPGDRDTFRALVDDGFREVVENGFPQEMIDNIRAQLEIQARLVGESSEIGVGLLASFSERYMDTGDPWAALADNEALDHIDEWNREGVFKALAEQYLVDSRLTALAVTHPAPGEKEARDAALAERLAEVKAGMSPAEIDAIVAASNAPTVENPDTPEMVKALTAVTVQSLPEEQRHYPVRDVTGEDGVRRIDVAADVDGIGYAGILLDAQGMPQENIHWMHLFMSLAGELDTTAHTHDELDVLWNRYLYGGSLSLFLAGEAVGEAKPRLIFRWIGLDRELDRGYALMREILFDTRFDDAKRLSDLINNRLNNLRADIDDAPLSYELSRSMGIHVPYARYSSYYGGLDYYLFLKDTAALCEQDPGAVADRLREVQAFFDNANGAISLYAGSEAGIQANRTAADAFLASLDSRPVAPVTCDLPTAAQREALIVNASVQGNGICADFESLGMEYDPEIDVVAKLVEDTILLPELRTRYGVYSVGHGVVSDYGLTIYTNQDPNVRQTFEVYDALPEMFEALELDQQTLDNYILNIYRDYAMPSGVLSGALDEINAAIAAVPPDQKLEDMRTLKALTPEKVRSYLDMYRALVEKGTRFSVGSAAAINEAGDLYDDILNPFGQADRTQMVLSDVDESHPDYDAIRFAFEEELMDAREDGSFGPSEPAAVGELARALFGLIVDEPATPARATEALMDFGVLPPEADAAAELTADTCEAMLTGFSDTIGVPYPGGMAGTSAPFTRAALARALAGYVQWLDGLQ